jgi:hypothetical protein
MQFYNERRGVLARYSIEAPGTSGGCTARLKGGAQGASIDATTMPAELVRAG